MRFPLLLALGVLLGAPLPSSIAAPGRERLTLDRDWLFHLGDAAFPVVTGHENSYMNAKAGTAWGAAAPDFDDADWRTLDLPHDWVVEGPFDPKENLSQGYRPRGIGWYRRYFTLPDSDRGRHLELQFDGVATHCTVWVNGILAHRNWCGYTSFSIDLTPFARFDKSLNTIAIRVDANAQEGWWYEGGGIYRHTWLVKRSPLHIATDGVYANPIRDAAGQWTIPVEVTLANSGRDAAPAEVEVSLLDPEGREVVRAKSAATVAPLEESVAKLPLAVPTPLLWSVDSPTLYTVRTVVKSTGAETDAVTTRCGFRTIRFDANAGFFLNDQPLKLQGVCNHQDHAGVGVAVPDALWDFRIRRLKEMGVNAYRCAHNPPAAEFLDAADRLGLLVMDENRNFNSTPEYVRQLEWLIRRDRNHPSVILWSVFNEEPMQGSEQGYEMVRRMAAVVKRLDSTRPVTAAMNGGLFTPVNVSQAVDVVGFNYQIGAYDRFHRENPKMALTSSEDTSAFMTRGEWHTDKSRNILGSYDDQRAPWGATHRDAWKAIAERPFLAGAFVWTGFDYRGEPTPMKWPSVSSFFGIMDLCGFPKMAFHLHQAQWVKDRPILTLVPHWNWDGREGKPIKVMALTNADTVALSLNGKLISEQPVDPSTMVSWDVPYAPGKLEAIAKKGGREVARALVETTGQPASLRLTADRPGLAGDGADAQPLTVEALDAQGRPVPTANLPVDFEIEGPGQIIGLGNGDPNSHEPEKGARRSLFNGLAQIIVQTKPDAASPLTLRAKAGNLRPAELRIPVTPAQRPFVAKAEPVHALRTWLMSPVTSQPPDPNQVVADNDMNSWTTIQPGRLPTFDGGAWALFRTKFQPRAALQKAGGRIVFDKIAGKAQIWLDGRLIGEKTSSEPASLSVPLPPATGERLLILRVETPPGAKAGLAGNVTVLP